MPNFSRPKAPDKLFETTTSRLLYDGHCLAYLVRIFSKNHALEKLYAQQSGVKNVRMRIQPFGVVYCLMCQSIQLVSCMTFGEVHLGKGPRF